MEKNSRVKHAQAWAVQGSLTTREKNSRVKGALAWVVQGRVTSWGEVLVPGDH